MSKSTPSCPIPTPVLACLSYATCSTTLTLANKFIFTDQLNYPWALLAIQSTFVSIILMTFQVLRGANPVSLTLLRQMLIPCILFTAFIYSNSQALRFVSLPVLSVIKSLAPMGIALVERSMFSDTMSPETTMAMFLIVVSSAVTMVNDIEYSIIGYLWSFGNVLVNIAWVISLRACLSDNFTPVDKALHSNVAAATIMHSLSLASGETLPFIEAAKQTDTFYRVVYVTSCLFAAGIGASIFWVVQTTSGSTLSFVGTCNKILIVILGGILFKTRITPIGWISIALGVFAGGLFTVAKARDNSFAKMEIQNNGKQRYEDDTVPLKEKAAEYPHDILNVSSDAEDDTVSEHLLQQKGSGSFDKSP